MERIIVTNGAAEANHLATHETARRLIDEAGVAGMPVEAFGAARTDWFRFALVTPRETDAKRLEGYFD